MIHVKSAALLRRCQSKSCCSALALDDSIRTIFKPPTVHIIVRIKSFHRNHKRLSSGVILLSCAYGSWKAGENAASDVVLSLI